MYCLELSLVLFGVGYYFFYHAVMAVFILSPLCQSSRGLCCGQGLRFSVFYFDDEAPFSAHRNSPPPPLCFNVCSGQVLAASALEGDKRITLSFRSSQYAPQTLLGRDVSSTLPPFKISFPEIPGTNAGWIDTTFIDEEIRVARSVLTRSVERLSPRETLLHLHPGCEAGLPTVSNL